ncbi:MAG: HAMP domain-containing histidine kinase [Acidimicrobiia bacterium]|nr:HAMP domain-containing histidine kinase [Acidimicrobiia bacterium]
MARSDQALAHPLTTALLIGYPALDVVLVAGAALLAAHVWDRAGTWPVWLALGLGLFGIADSTAAVARLRGADAGMNGTLWMAALLALGAGALVWRRSRREMHPTQATTLSHEAAPSVGARMVPYAVVVGAVAVYALAPAQDRQGLAITVLTILGGVVIAARELVGVIHEARAKQHLAGRLEIQQRTTDALRASLADWDRAVWVRRDLLERARERMRTPVMSMLGMLDLLEGQVQTDYERSEVVTLRLGLVQLLNAIDDLVEVSDPELARVGEGGTRSLIDIGERAVEMLEALAVQNGVRIDHEHEATAGPGGHSVHVPSGAAALMQRVARELLVHAVTNASHLVRLRLEPTGEGGVRLLVIDDRADITGGSGRDVVDRHLVERELAVEPELALAAQLVESAGGKLTAETRPGISRTVVAWLPGPGGLLWGGGVDDVSGSPG